MAKVIKVAQVIFNINILMILKMHNQECMVKGNQIEGGSGRWHTVDAGLDHGDRFEFCIHIFFDVFPFPLSKTK
jgi:hypothetical protein